MGDLLVECPIHLDAVPIQEILVFKCGHGFCEPCLEAHFAHHRQSGNPLSCPTCRQPVRRKEAFPVFLAPAQPGSARNQPGTAEGSHTRLIRELREAKAAHASCSERVDYLQYEVDALRAHDARQDQTIQHLRDRHELLEQHLAKEVDKFARANEENNRMREEMAKLQAENHKTSKALEQALQEAQVQYKRVKQFQDYIVQHKHKRDLQKKKRRAVENATRHLQPTGKKEDDSLMVVDSNAPDTLRQDGLDLGWLDKACKVKGDQFTIASDDDLEFEKESEDEPQYDNHDAWGEQRVSRIRLEGEGVGNKMQYSPRAQGDPAIEPSLKFRSDWSLGLEMMGKPPSGISQKRNRQAGGSKIVKVKIPAGTGTRKLSTGPLTIDRQGRVNGVVALGSRQRLNSKN